MLRKGEKIANPNLILTDFQFLTISNVGFLEETWYRQAERCHQVSPLFSVYILEILSGNEKRKKLRNQYFIFKNDTNMLCKKIFFFNNQGVKFLCSG